MASKKLTADRKQRHKRAANAARPRMVSAAISIQPELYHQALGVAEQVAEGNFSRYVRKLIKRDLTTAA